MAFLVTCIDKENSLELRLATREKHINYLKGIGDKVILAGPILDKKDLPCGTVLILDFNKLKLLVFEDLFIFNHMLLSIKTLY